ncbi:hypothetical protein [Microviridae sp.]|nr:hypothetical protein [Microviridae sp.]
MLGNYAPATTALSDTTHRRPPNQVVAKQRPRQSPGRPGLSQKDHGSPIHSRLDRAICKERPKNNRSKGGGSKPFVPWCERKT